MNDFLPTTDCPEAIRSDKGAPFASPNGWLGLAQLSVWWLAMGIDLERSRPGCPQDNGGHERLHPDIARELEGVEHKQRQAAFETCRREFNEERPHQALEMRVPAELYQASLRKWNGTPEQISYPGMASRRVKKLEPFVTRTSGSSSPKLWLDGTWGCVIALRR